MSELIGAAVELMIGERPRLEDERGGERIPRRLLFEKRHERLVAVEAIRGVPLDHLLLFAGSQERQLGQTHVRRRRDRIEQHAVVADEPLDRLSCEQIRVVGEDAAHPVGLLHHRIVPLAEEMHVEVEVRHGHGEVIEVHVVGDAGRSAGSRPGQPSRGGHVFELERHLEQWVAAQIALEIQLLHQPLERQLLMRVAVDADFAHAADQLAERRIANEIGTQCQRVHEVADQRFELDARAGRDRRADQDVVLSSVALQQHIERRQHRHEQRRVLGLAELLQPIDCGVRQRQADGPGAELRDRWPREVGLEIELGHIREVIRPVLQRLIQLRALDLLALPARVVAVLHRQRRQRDRRHAGKERHRELRYFVEKNLGGGAVADAVVDGREIDRLVLVETDDAVAPQRADGEIELPADVFAYDLERARLARRRRQVAQIVDRDARLRRRCDDLHRHAVDHLERGPQHFVAADQLRHHLLPDVRTRGEPQAEDERHVVRRHVRHQLLDQPQPFLRERQREAGRRRILSPDRAGRRALLVVQLSRQQTDLLGRELREALRAHAATMIGSPLMDTAIRPMCLPVVMKRNASISSDDL